MPQLDIATYLSQAFWLVICFCFLWAMMSFFITPKIADIQEQRKRKINDYLQKAEKLNKKAQESLEKYNSTLQKAKHNAQKEIENAQAVLQNYLKETEHNSAKKLNKQIADNELT